MRISRFLFTIATAVLMSFHSSAHAAEPTSDPERAIQAAAQDGTLLYLLFYRDADAVTNGMFETVKTAAGQHPKTSWATVKLSDPAQRSVAERFKVTRTPMPMLIALHPNGSVTGVFRKRVTPEALAQCIVSPKEAECMQLDPQQNNPTTVFLAPPGVLVGKFPPSATKQQLAEKLDDAGKCCDDENCKHNHKSPRGAATPGKVTR